MNHTFNEQKIDDKEQGIKWIVIRNCLRNSLKLKLEPCHLDGSAVIFKPFAHIYQTNLKKLGVLALMFAGSNYDDKINFWWQKKFYFNNCSIIFNN